MEQSEIVSFLEEITEPDQVVEIRLLDANKQWRRGYFDREHLNTIPKELKRFNDAIGVYFTPNPLKPDLLARCANRIATGRDQTPMASDKDVVRQRWLLIDCDAKRAIGISASDTERELTKVTLMRILADFARRGVKPKIIADSGNGYHAMFPVDESIGFCEIKTILNYAHEKYSDEHTDVDLKVANPGRIWKLYGTMARKGDSVPGRPHRMSRVMRVVEDCEPLDIFRYNILLSELFSAQVAAESLKRVVPKSQPQLSGSPREWLVKFIESNLKTTKYKSLGSTELWEVDCPFNPEHKRKGYICYEDGRGWGYKCHAESCADNGWAELKALFGGTVHSRITNAKIAPVVTVPEPEPVPELASDKGDVAFPFEVLNRHDRDVIDCIASEIQAPRELVAHLVIGAYSAAISGRAKVATLSQPLNLYMAIKMPPSSRKSECYSAAFAPFREAQHDIFSDKRDKLASLEQEQGQILSLLQATPKDNPMRDQYQEQLNGIKQRVSQAKAEKSRLLIAEDVTSETLIRLVDRNGGEIALASAEGDVINNISRTYSSRQEASLLLYLKGYGGESMHFARSSSDTDIWVAPYITIVAAGQNEDISKFLTNETLIRRGLISRFIVASCTQTEKPDARKKSKYAEYDVYKQYCQRIKNLIAARGEALLELNDEAERQYESYCNKMTGIAFEPNRELGEISWVQKNHARMLRLAGLLTVSSEGAVPSTISADTICRATVLAEHYRAQHSANQSVVANDFLIQRFIRYVRSPKYDGQPICRRDLRRHVTRGQSLEDHRRFLDLVEQTGIGSLAEVQMDGGRPQQVVIPGKSLLASRS